MSYGVQPTGFVRKSFNQILLDIEAAMVTEFGPNVIQTAQSPFGQINGLMADYITQLWEMAEDVYQSYDPDQAEGTRLDTLAEIRLMRRQLDETDTMFRFAITNTDQGRIDIQDIDRAVRNVAGVTYCHVWVNDDSKIDPATGLPGGTLCVAVLGGDDNEIAAALRPYVVPGISMYGNTYVTTDQDGFCRTLVILRPALVPVVLRVDVALRHDAHNCPPPSVLAIRDALVAALAPNGTHELLNGDDISHYRIRSVIESLFPSVEVQAIFTGRTSPPVRQTLEVQFVELATLDPKDVEINPV